MADRGYALIRQGDQAVDKVFDTAITQSDGTDLHSIFGKPLVHKLSVAGREKTYTYLRQKFVAAAHRGRLYRKSVTSLLGLPAPSASGWTLHELTVHFSKGPAVLTDLLVDLGHDRDSIGRSILPDETADQLEPFRHSVTRSQAAARLGIAEKVLGELVRSGILTPLATRNSTDGKCLEFYGPSDIERARTVIFDNCTGVFGAGGAPFAMAAGLVGRSTTTLMSLLTRGSCSWASLPKDATKIGQIHVQVETLRAAVRGDDAPLGVEMAAGLLGLGRSTVMALIKTGRLSRGMGTNPVNLRKQVCIDRDELARFAVDHVSARTLSDSLPSRAKMINRYLDHLGVAHIGDGIRLYAWTDLERALLVMRSDGLTDALRTAAVDFHFRN